MDKKEFLKNLKAYVQKKGISIYDYYYQYAETLRYGFEHAPQDPFVSNFDIQLLLNSSDARIEEYFARAMEKVIALQEEALSKTEIREVVDEKMEEVYSNKTTPTEASLSREDIESVIHEKMGEVYPSKTPTEASLSREDIESVINEKVAEVYPNKTTTKSSTIAREDIMDAINERLISSKVKVTSIDKNIADVLGGFAVIKEEKTGRIHLYQHDVGKKTLQGERIFFHQQNGIHSGYYVRYEDYIDRIMNDILEKYPNASNLLFIREDGKVRSFGQVVEEAYAIASKNGVVRYGNALIGKDIKTFQKLRDLNLNEVEYYEGEPLKVGVYVRRDILTRIFARYKVQVHINQDDFQKQSTK